MTQRLPVVDVPEEDRIAAMRLHATELLLLLGTAIVLLVEHPTRRQPAQTQVDRNATADALTSP